MLQIVAAMIRNVFLANAGGDEALVCSAVDSDGNDITIVACARICAQTGDLEWVPEYDGSRISKRTVAMSLMSSMLRDNDRNRVYDDAIKLCIANFSAKAGRAPIVLDIGAGTGLLSMLASRNGAAAVVGCEMYQPLTEIAETIVICNYLSGIVIHTVVCS